MSDEKMKCVICGEEATLEQPLKWFGTTNKCSKCGTISFELSAEKFLESSQGTKFKACLFYYFMHYKKKDNKYLIVKNPIEKEGWNVITIQEIMNLYPKDISERIDKVLLNFSVLSKGLGNKIDFSNRSMLLKVVFAENDDELEFLFKTLEALGYINEPSSDTLSEPLSFQIQYRGWERIDEIQKENKTKNQGFIAMWFDSEMNEVKLSIEKAIERAGYMPMIINEKEHNNQIVPGILYEIRNSDFLVADLTENRGGVYYEAGYAFGQGKEVIITVDETKDEPHFDVAQKNQVRYKTPEELEERLYKRIISTVGDKKQKK